MVDHKDDSFQRVEVISGVGRRRNLPNDFKALVVAESLEPGAVISQVARRHGLTPQQLFGWRNQMRSASPSVRTEAASKSGQISTEFAPVMVAAPPSSPSGKSRGAPAMRDLIEIIVGSTVIRVRVAVDADTLMAVLRAVKATL